MGSLTEIFALFKGFFTNLFKAGGGELAKMGEECVHEAVDLTNEHVRGRATEGKEKEAEKGTEHAKEVAEEEAKHAQAHGHHWRDHAHSEAKLRARPAQHGG